MQYIINVAESIPRGRITETRHYCEIRLASSIGRDDAYHILQSLRATWPIQRNDGGAFIFKLVSVEERDVTH